MERDLTDLEVATALGKHPCTIQRWCSKGTLPGSYKAGRSWRIPRAALRAARVARAFEPDAVEDELRAATVAAQELGREVEDLRRTRRASRRLNWRVIAREVGALKAALSVLPDHPDQVPPWLQRSDDGCARP